MLLAMQSAAEVLEFWFSDRVRERWWVKDPAFDEEIRERFAGLHRRALAGDLESWAASPEGALALVIVLDQFPRNMFRGSAEAFASDAAARAVTDAALAAGHHHALTSDDRRLFLYLPLEHSEKLADQDRCCALAKELAAAQWYEFAKKHREIVARFGRFPHRNEALGRESTAEERLFLTEPGSSF